MENYATSMVSKTSQTKKDFLDLVVDGRHDDAILLLEDFINAFPHQRQLALFCWETVRNFISIPNVERECARIFHQNTVKIRENGRKELGLPPIMEVRVFQQRLGEFAEQTALTKIFLKTGKLNQKPLLPLPNSKTCNQGFLPYLHDTFDVIEDPQEAVYWSSHTRCSPYSSYLTGFDDKILGHCAFFLNELKSHLGPEYFEPIFVLKDETIEKAKPFLKKFGVDTNEPFVTFHVRSDGYGIGANGNHHSHRNINPDVFEDSVNLLLQNGIKVIRIGHSNMPPMQEAEGFIDLTKEERPGEVDIFLSAKALFYMGTASGPLALAHLFGAPTFCVNVWPFLTVRDKSLNMPSKVLNLKNGKFLSLKDVLQSNFRECTSSLPLKRQAFEFLPPEKFEVLEATKEMINIFPQLSKNKISEKKLDHTLHPNIPKSALIAEVSSYLL